MLKSRRGLLAAGLAVAVVGAIGVASTLNAGADQIPGDQDATQATVAAAADATAQAGSPPPTLPWGARPVRAHRGPTGMSSRALHDQGLQAASDSSGQHLDFSPKGKSTRTSFLKSEQTDVQPPAPAASPSAGATTTDPATTSPTTAPTTSPAVTDPTTASTSTAKSVVAPVAAATATATATPPATTSPSASASGTDNTVNFLYSVGTQAITADGVYASMDIARPTLAQGDYHTLAELAVQSADSQQIVEVGWNVDRGVNGDDQTHIFVYHWINGQTTCYNACGFLPYDGGIKAGDTVPVDTTKKFGIVYFNNAWWIAYDTTFVGSFPDSQWSSQGVTFNKVGLFQAFGEVAASSATPCTQMGIGVKVTDDAGARIGNVTYVNGPTPSLYMRTTTSVYAMDSLSTRTFRYGGLGAC